MNFILFDDNRNQLLPITFTRPVCDIRIGILTIREKWEKYLKSKTSTLTEDYLAKKFPLIEKSQNLLINGSVCPNSKLLKDILSLKNGEALYNGETIVAINSSSSELTKYKNKKETNIC